MTDMIVLGISIAILVLLIFARAYAVRKDFERREKNLYALHAAYKTLDEELMTDWGIEHVSVMGEWVTRSIYDKLLEGENNSD